MSEGQSGFASATSAPCHEPLNRRFTLNTSVYEHLLQYVHQNTSFLTENISKFELMTKLLCLLYRGANFHYLKHWCAECTVISRTI